MKPKVFIGSSSEGLEIAQAIQYQLSKEAEIVLWNEGVFALSHGYLETLVNAVSQFDYGIFVLRSDDTLVSRGRETGTTRGNVLFELGMFFGHLGRSRTFAVYDSSERPDVISDLHGVSFAPYDGSRTRDVLSAVGPACFSIRQELKNWGARVEARKILLLFSNPQDMARLRVDVEARNITAALQAARRSGDVTVEQEWAVQARELDRILLIHRPAILHVACSGFYKEGLIFEDTIGNSKAVSHNAFLSLLHPITDTLECVVFSSCETDTLASSLGNEVQCAIGAGMISDEQAIVFTSGFYTAIGNSSDYQTAYQYGLAKMSIDHPDGELFKMYPEQKTA